MSDSVVLWRMCVVWGNARIVVVFGAVLLATTLGLNIANITASAREELFESNSGPQKIDDVELIATYGTQYVGLAAAFVSLAGNFCATLLVGVKAWYSIRQVSKQMHSAGNGRTLVQRVMELLAESGIVYTAIWVDMHTLSFMLCCHSRHTVALVLHQFLSGRYKARSLRLSTRFFGLLCYCCRSP
ncbi:hypothetical protein PENSPDRAFT_594080 [Peniophora sp. CONT]|nr:hypothetical protein PENSPDRAFT_594080 [Peniophora sp. CONT]